MRDHPVFLTLSPAYCPGKRSARNPHLDRPKSPAVWRKQASGSTPRSGQKLGLHALWPRLSDRVPSVAEDRIMSPGRPMPPRSRRIVSVASARRAAAAGGSPAGAGGGRGFWAFFSRRASGLHFIILSGATSGTPPGYPISCGLPASYGTLVGPDSPPVADRKERNNVQPQVC